ncbi:alanine racemase [Sporobacter termitidis DSM 10068]|uniref:Alanine racemase n=1 Tax=Sporobacter termitidis DSM 10068 TaxID=1123282 RepID=A0A1M5ZEZ6_9FIRM|nr:serine racemase VanT catalytic subunit [Sporobacter termitidis]SHI22732.1 alanine racemase [Sporobacter termitidis DSM 10068]
MTERPRGAALDSLLACAISAAAAGVLIHLRPTLRKPRPAPDARAWIEVSRAALRHNAAELQNLLPTSCRLMAVVKADAYGHGAIGVARELEKAGVRAFAVATLSEGIALRRGGVRGEVLVLGYTLPSEASFLHRYRLAQTVVDGAYAAALHAAGVPLDVHIKLDTGMHRLGADWGDTAALEGIFGYNTLTVKGVFTHLSQADDLSDEAADFTLGQIGRFIDAVNTLKAKGYDTGALHIQESYGILNYPGLPCDWARAGIALYGVLCKNDQTRLTPDLQPALALKARIAEVKQVAGGEYVGYGRRFMAKTPMKLAAVTIGYADGIPRNSVHRDAWVLLRGQRAPVVGLICMDILLIDVTHIDDAAPGDIVTLIGKDGGGAIRCEDVAESCGTITNELLSRLGARLPRIFV